MMANVSEMILKTSAPWYQFTFKWIIENYSELPINWTKRSEGFSVEPESSWYVEFQKTNAYNYLYLRRNDVKSFKAICETLTLNCKDEILHEGRKSYENEKEVDLLPGGSYMDLFKNLPEDKVTFKILIKIKSPEPSTVCLNLFSNPTEVAPIWEKNLSKDLKTLLNKQVKTDVTINIGGETLSAHKNILMSRSEVFAKMFQKGMAEEEDSVVNIEDIDFNTMKIVLSFMYSAQLDECDSETALEVYRAADKYAVSDLRDACAHVLSSKMSMENVCKVLSFADMCHQQELKEKAMQFIALHYKSKQTEFQEKS